MTEEQFNRINQNSYFVGEFQVFTMPLVKSGYLIPTEQMIFVSSKLPKDERAKVVDDLIARERNQNAKSAV